MVLVDQVSLQQGEPRFDQAEVPRGEQRVERIELGTEGVEGEPVPDQVAGQSDLVLLDDRQLSTLTVDAAEQSTEAVVLDNRPAEGQEVGAHVEVVDHISLELPQQFLA